MKNNKMNSKPETTSCGDVPHNGLQIMSVRETPELTENIIEYVQKAWPEVAPEVYRDSILSCIYSPSPLPGWVVLVQNDHIIGCAGLVTNDFNSRMDLWPWLCAVYVSEDHRGNNYGKLLIETCIAEAKKSGYKSVYLTTSLLRYYEEFGFMYYGEGFDLEGEPVSIYRYDIIAAELGARADFTIRPEEPVEFDTIYNLIEDAFKTAKVSDGGEQDFAVSLRKQSSYVSELALVAVMNDEIAAHIMLTGTDLGDTDEKKIKALLLAPVSVAENYRDAGVGSAIIEESMRRATQMGYDVVFLIGDPYYYHRFGFRSIEGSAISIAADIPLRFVMYHELWPGAIRGKSGVLNIV